MPDNRQDERYEIEQLLFRYAWMTDERKWELMDELFVPEGTIDYVSSGGTA
ncbi:nuclear transport factor 2 family protein [Parahaliea sp. F7430]|uniref:Nuclear transport factor 2 family protein n=1 Tax=Sediminihaliea albiluteola TaxID=2758564 RepID=A0A7W2TTQ5_9GAMM|nr:nuclear transport factor 2 family protein [Sediminihaliea albiluteola]MBA6411819.1 nuclear transport factor 2 family protein [Sediminihaliea albiluteola]